MTGADPLTARALPGSLRLEGAERLVGATSAASHPKHRRETARGLLRSLDALASSRPMLFACLDRNAPAGRRVGPVCCVVPGSGRTGMLFLSEPAPDAEPDHPERLAAAVNGAVEWAEGRAPPAAGETPPPLGLLQALPGPTDLWAIDALARAGFVDIGTLAYMRRGLAGEDERLLTAAREDDPWPEDVSVEAMSPPGIAPDASAWSSLTAALERSYIDTLDCPGLCGLRTTQDVLDSHRSAGIFDGSLWDLVRTGGTGEGCCLISRTLEPGAYELVYMGLGPRLRGRGLGRRLLAMGLVRAARRGGKLVSLAVDERNRPAKRVYASLGFTPFASRVGLVRAVRAGG